MTRPMGAVVVVAVVVLLAACASSDDGAGARVSSTTSSEVLPTESNPVTADIEPCPGAKTAQPVDGGPPDLRLPCLGPGPDVNLAELRGPLVVNVWASWCGPCRDEMPWLQRLQESSDVDVLGIDAEDQSGAAAALLDELGVSYPSLFDPQNAIASEVGTNNKPISLLISASGEVVQTELGPFTSYDDLVDSVEEHLGVTVQ
ncbi:MAG TPA: TlpA disulfide reductase family protein [Actinomycetes bacterium]|nr:TlpA disulfide reductase family protein [Actinomycetes bacterium]